MRPKLNLAALEAMPEGPDKEEAKRLIAGVRCGRMSGWTI
jgi:hypothetical protein